MAPLVPALSSRPSAPVSLYLDFNGHTEPQWGKHTNVSTPAYDTDGDQSTFSAAEQAAIREIWSRVAEDYAPFNVNVTTVAQPAIADRVAVRVAIGGSYSDWYGNQAGGVAYVNGFDSSSSNVAYVFASALNSGNPRLVAEAASHEAGHVFGLEHQATWSGSRLVAEYSTGTAALAPIMGVGYYSDRTTWTSGATGDGPNARQDDLSILGSTFGYVPDDFGNTLTTAASLPTSSTSPNVAGLIGANGDRDVFKFSTGGGRVSFSVDVAQYGPNLDAVVELQNASGQSIVLANPSTTLGASLSATVAAGTYYAIVRSTGGYGNLGHYTLHATLPTATTPPPISTSPPPSTSPSTPAASTSTRRITDNGDTLFSSLGSWRTLSGVGYSSDTQWAAAGSGAASTWTFTGLTPGTYRLAGSWQASAMNATDAPFTVSSGGKLLATARVNQQRSPGSFLADGTTWQNLGSFTVTGNTLTVRLTTSLTGRVIADALRLQRV